jgi:hypothetical protein
MKLQFPLWRLCASLTCFAIAFGLGRLAFTLPPYSFWPIFSGLLAIAFFFGAIGVLFRRGLEFALGVLQVISSFVL